MVHLEAAPRLNLALIDLVWRLGRPASRRDPPSELMAVWEQSRLVGLAALRPSVMLDALAEPEVLEALFPHLSRVGSGLVKSTEARVGPLWDWLESRGHRALLDRIEISYVVEPAELCPVPPPAGWTLRSARDEDLDGLVEAARESLREEDRPDPSQGDPAGFRRWVHGRLPRAVVGEHAGSLGFVGYADVQCPRGWLLQGVYTWTGSRCQGVASAGVSELCRRAFESRAQHVQLAVVEGNLAAEKLYARLGFEPHARLRTLLFS